MGIFDDFLARAAGDCIDPRTEAEPERCEFAVEEWTEFGRVILGCVLERGHGGACHSFISAGRA
jgi:hypothetical protein